MTVFKSSFHPLRCTRIPIWYSDKNLKFRSTTPISPEKITGMVDRNFRFLSEYQIGIRVQRKGWKDDLKTVINYLGQIHERVVKK
jgi:hypothetical protein